jgi:putative nucleotidyltransferase with HDIG domain
MNRRSGYDELVILLCTGISQRKMYFDEHPKVAACGEDFILALRELLHADGKESFFLGVVDGKLVHNGRYLVGSSIVGRRLITFAGQLRSGGFLFSRALEPSELRDLFTLAAQLAEPLLDIKEARTLLEARGLRHISLSPPYEDPAWFGQFLFDGAEAWGGEMIDGSALAPMLPIYQSLFGAVESAHHVAGSRREPDVAGLRGLSEQLLQTGADGLMDLMQLVRYPDYDSYTVGHSVRVAMIAVLVGRRLGLAAPLLVELGTAGLLHDVGKARIPEEILYKPGPLTLEERQIIRSHATHGAHILLESRDAGPLGVAAAWGHHLRHDGGGYPASAPWAVCGGATSLVHVCDVFEALTAVRPYKLAMTPRRAYEIMLQDRGAFDPALLAAFVAAMGIYPPGSRVRLSNGEHGIVVAAGAAVDRPRVKVSRGADGRPLPPDAQRIVDLALPAAGSLSVSGFLLDDTTAPPNAPDRDQTLQPSSASSP